MLSIRKIGVVGRTYRNLNRYRQILAVLFKYGFGDLIELLKIDQYLEIGLQLISRNRRQHFEKLSRAERVRMAFEELVNDLVEHNGLPAGGTPHASCVVHDDDRQHDAHGEEG